MYQSVVKKRHMAYGSVQARHAILTPLVQLCFVNWHVGSVHRLLISEIAELIWGVDQLEINHRVCLMCFKLFHRKKQGQW